MPLVFIPHHIFLLSTMTLLLPDMNYSAKILLSDCTTSDCPAKETTAVAAHFSSDHVILVILVSVQED